MFPGPRPPPGGGGASSTAAAAAAAVALLLLRDELREGFARVDEGGVQQVGEGACGGAPRGLALPGPVAVADARAE